MFTYLGEALTWKVQEYVNNVLENGFYNATWYQCDATWPLPPLPDPAPTGLVYPAVDCYDDSTPVNSNIYIDGHASQSINSVFPLTPGFHNIGVDKYIPTSGGYGYIFTDIYVEGNTYYDNEVQAELSTNTTIAAHYTYGLLPVYTLTVNAFDAYLGEYYPYEVNVYIDNNFVGTTPLQIQVQVGDHMFSVDATVAYSEYWPAWDVPFYDFTGDFNGYNPNYNTVTLSMYSTSNINARYTQWQ